MDYRTASMLPPPGLPPQPSPGQTFGAGADRGRALRRARWLRRLELAALGYIVCISAGVFGFIDILVLGSAYSKTSESLFAQLLWPAAYLLFAGLVLWRWRELLGAARRCWWVLPFPALAGLSVLWSMDADATTGAAVRMAATTAIALYIGARFLPAVTAKAVFAVLLAAVGASVLTGAVALEFAMDGPVVRGLFHHKNTLGSRAALLAVVSLALALSGWRPALAVAGAVLGAMATVLSSSAAGLALGAIALLAAPFALSLRGGSLVLGLRITLVGILTVVVLFALTLWRIDPIAGALAALDRDATLTGRVDLWQVAIAQIAQRPLLGAGFDAFWNAGLDWQALALLERLGSVLQFHNTSWRSPCSLARWVSWRRCQCLPPMCARRCRRSGCASMPCRSGPACSA